MSSEYHGWTNYPTACVYEWVTSNDEDYAMSVSYAKAGTDELKKAVEDSVLSHAAERGLTRDLLLFVLDAVNYQEVADALNDK